MVSIVNALNLQWKFVIFFLLILAFPILLIQLSIRSDDNKLQKERNKNYKETGYRETDQERRDREHREESERIRQTERENNYKETGYRETDQERRDRERREENEKRIQLEKSRLENKAYELKNKLSEEQKKKIDARYNPNKVKRKEGSDCYLCKTKVNKDGYCFC